MRYLRNKWIWITAIFWILTPFMFRLAYLERGYEAIGGELLFPLIPFLLWALVKTIKDIGKEVKNA